MVLQTHFDHLENVSTGRTSSAYFSGKDQGVADSNLSSVLSGYACASSFPGTQVLCLSIFFEYAVNTMCFAFLSEIRQFSETIMSSTKVYTIYKVIIS